MTTKKDLTRIVKAVVLGTAIAVGASYMASCTPKYKKLFTPIVPSGKDKLDILYGER